MDSYEREELRRRFTELREQLRRNGHLDPARHVMVRGERVIPYNRFSYSEEGKAELQSPRWRFLTRSLVTERRACENCHGWRRLQAHHRYYFAGRRAWEYSREDFLLLCGICHTLVHFGVDRAIETAARYDREDVERARQGVDEDMLAWEVDMALGFYRDPTLEYDEDNPGYWEPEYEQDPGDVSNEDAAWD